MLHGAAGVLVSALALAAPAAAEPACPLQAADRVWVEQVLATWLRATREVLDVSPRPLPWIVLFDSRCVFHVAARPEPLGEFESLPPLVFLDETVPVRSGPHGGTVLLPNGGQVPAQAMAFASVYAGGSESFFALAGLELWRRREPEAGGEGLAPMFLGVAAHEIVHTRQLVAVNRRVEALGREFELPERISDTVVEEQFRRVPGFAAGMRAERDLLFRAAAAGSDRALRRHARLALRRIHERRARYFTGKHEPLGEIEDLLLGLEGLAVWVHFQLAARDPAVAFLSDHHAARALPEVLRLLEGKSGEWMQDAGFALCLVLDRLAPGWQRKLLQERPASLVALLAKGLAVRPTNPRRQSLDFARRR